MLIIVSCLFQQQNNQVPNSSSSFSAGNCHVSDDHDAFGANTRHNGSTYVAAVNMTTNQPTTTTTVASRAKTVCFSTFVKVPKPRVEDEEDEDYESSTDHQLNGVIERTDAADLHVLLIYPLHIK
jgi:hypothetical protein